MWKYQSRAARANLPRNVSVQFCGQRNKRIRSSYKKIYSIYILLDPYNLDQKHDWGNRMEKIILGKKKKYIFSKNSLII